MGIFPAAVLVADGPQCACTYIYRCVVHAVGLVAAPPVGEVNHKVEDRTDFLSALFVEAVGTVVIFKSAHEIGTVGKAFELHPGHTSACTKYGREPFAGIDACSGREAVGEIAVDGFVREVDVCTTFCSDEPVVLHTVEEYALAGVGNVLHIFCRLLSNNALRASEHCEGKRQESSFLHRDIC